MNTWYVVYWTATGEADSFGTTIADPLATGLTSRSLSPLETEMICDGTGLWDPATLQVVARPAVG